MAFKALFLAHAPDADYEKHNNVIDTGKYKLFTVVVKTQNEASKRNPALTYGALIQCKLRLS